MNLMFPAALGPGIYSASNRNEYQKKRKCFWGVERGRHLRLTNPPPSVSRLCRQCGILNISQPCRPPRPATGITLLFFSIFIYSDSAVVFCSRMRYWRFRITKDKFSPGNICKVRGFGSRIISDFAHKMTIH
jgi:hypothetical protein